MEIERLRFLNRTQVLEIASRYGSPVFVYSENEIVQRTKNALNFPNEYGLTVRFAMKANPNRTILNILKREGILIDASSEFEVERALLAGFSPKDILLTGQQPPSKEKLKEFVDKGVEFNACSLHQLELYGSLFPKANISIRINPGLGSGGTKKTDVGGTTSSFGIWHESIPEVKDILNKYNLTVKRVHTHIGSGSDPEVWKAVAHYTLEYAEIFSEATIVNLGGGYKVGRMSYEKTTDFQLIGAPVRAQFKEFFEKTGRKLHLEIEPGTSMIANCGSLISEIMDSVSTGSKGHNFLKLNSGMDSNTRPSLYGSEHPLIVVPKNEKTHLSKKDYIVVGHCCESGDLFTQEFGGEPKSRPLNSAEIGDFMVMEGVGAYCSSMSTKNYNSFPEIPEVMIRNNGEIVQIRKIQTMNQILENEVKIEI
jgi:diaminopimelate decarboxylase